MARSKPENTEIEYGKQYKPEVQNVIRLTLAFAEAVGRHQQDKSDNLVIAPYNAMSAISMAAKGADGKTREELAQALFGAAGKDLDAAAGDYAALNKEVLQANKGQVELTTANGIWVNQDIVTLRDDFAGDMKGTFDAEISAENFGDTKTVDKINKWAADNTNGLIPKVLEELKEDDAAILASALYFKGQWTHKFDKSLTEKKDYVQDGGKVAQTPTMHQDFDRRGDLSFNVGDDYEAVSLTYGEKNAKEGKHPTMRIVLVRPSDETVSARDWLASQAGGKIPAWLDADAFRSGVGSVELPRLDIKQNFDLIPAMKDMGVKEAFNKRGADFTKMAQQDGNKLFIGKISHDTVFKTDEEGSEAAAVTVVGMVRATSIQMPPPRMDIKLDRSFVFALQDVETGAVLFIGAVNKPNGDMQPQAVQEKKSKASKPAR
ncbi:MAG: serpin family protein [Alphaproteobacteria bacterium]|nr:serpin family protein [Alphaproteobacteria bacterium]